jgi:hypothetical protein
MKVYCYHPDAAEMIGILPHWLDENDLRPAREQFHSHYGHGGGWRPFSGFTFNKSDGTIKYPGDPAHKPLAAIMFRDEAVIFYESAWVLILQRDGTYEVARMD